MENLLKGNENSDEHRKDMVQITIAENDYLIHRGRQTVLAIKTLGGINPNNILVEIVNGQLIDLPSDGSITIKGGEIFNSHPPIGDNS